MFKGNEEKSTLWRKLQRVPEAEKGCRRKSGRWPRSCAPTRGQNGSTIGSKETWQAATGTPVIALQYKEVSPGFSWRKAGSELVAASRTE